MIGQKTPLKSSGGTGAMCQSPFRILMFCQLWAAFEKSRVPQLLILAVSGTQQPGRDFSVESRLSPPAVQHVDAEVSKNVGLLQPDLLFAHLVRAGQLARLLGAQCSGRLSCDQSFVSCATTVCRLHKRCLCVLEAWHPNCTRQPSNEQSLEDALQSEICTAVL